MSWLSALLHEFMLQPLRTLLLQSMLVPSQLILLIEVTLASVALLLLLVLSLQDLVVNQLQEHLVPLHRLSILKILMLPIMDGQ